MKIEKIKNILLMNANLTYQEYQNVLNYVDNEMSYANIHTLQDHNVIALINNEIKKV